MELAPLVGLADIIVTWWIREYLARQWPGALDHIVDISSRLIINQASLKMKHDAIGELVNKIEATVESRISNA